MSGYPGREQKKGPSPAALQKYQAPALHRTDTRVIEQLAHKKSVKREYLKQWEQLCEWAALHDEDISDATDLDNIVCKFLQEAYLAGKSAEFAESTVAAAKFHVPAGRTALWRARLALKHWGEPQQCKFWLEGQAFAQLASRAFAITDVDEKILYSSCLVTCTNLRGVSVQVRCAVDGVMTKALGEAGSKQWLTAIAQYRTQLTQGAACRHPFVQLVVRNSPGLLGLEAVGYVQEKEERGYNYGGCYSWLCMRGKMLGSFWINTLAWHYWLPEPPHISSHEVGLDLLTEHVQEGVRVVVAEDVPSSISRFHKVELIKAGTKGVVSGLGVAGDAMIEFDNVHLSRWVLRSQFDKLAFAVWDKSGLGRQLGASKCEVKPQVTRLAARLSELCNPALERDVWRLLNPGLLRTLTELFPDAKYDVALLQQRFARYDSEAPYAKNLDNGSYDFALQGRPHECYVAADLEIVDWGSLVDEAFPQRNNSLTMLRTQQHLHEPTVEYYCKLLRSATESNNEGRPTVVAFDFFAEGNVNRTKVEDDDDGNEHVKSIALDGEPVPQKRSIEVSSSKYPRNAKLFIIDGHHKLEASVREGCSINVLVFAAAGMPYSCLSSEEGNLFTRKVSFPSLTPVEDWKTLKATWPVAEQCLHCTWQLSSSRSPDAARFASYGCGCHDADCSIPKWAYALLARQTRLYNRPLEQAKVIVREEISKLPPDHPLLNEHFGLCMFELSEDSIEALAEFGLSY